MARHHTIENVEDLRKKINRDYLIRLTFPKERKRRGKSDVTGKPVLLWAETGTNQRSTKTQTRIWARSRKGHNTGRMKRYGFMLKTKNQISGQVQQDLRNEIIESVTKTAKRYGCT